MNMFFWANLVKIRATTTKSVCTYYLGLGNTVHETSIPKLE